MIKFYEELALNAWPALQTQLYDGWILRFANGFTKRSNSINPLYDSFLPLEEKIAACEAKYKLYNLPVIFKLKPDGVPQEIDGELAKRNYRRLDETSVRVLDLHDYQYRNCDAVLKEPAFSDDWLSDFSACANLAVVQQRTAKLILENILGKVVFVRKKVNGQTVGCGYGAIEREDIGIFDIIVAPNERGKGYGREILNGILNAASEANVKQAYLAVVVGNVPAESLYQKLGFKEIYRYWYRQKSD